MNGMFLDQGFPEEPGKSERLVSVTDFAPTVAAYLGVSWPEVDGQAITELISPVGAKAHEPSC